MILKSKYNSKIKILITGGYGFVGSHIFNFLKKKNYKIYRHSSKIHDLSNVKIFKNILIRCQPDVIVHLAARTVPAIRTKKEDQLQYQNTTLPTINLVNSLKYCYKLKKIIFFGTIEEYGLAELPFSERQKLKPVSSYGLAKVKALQYVKKKIKNNNKINYVWLRPSLIFGKNDNKKRFLGSLLNSLYCNKKIKVSLDYQIRDFLYVNDLCRLIELLIIKKDIKVNGSVLNITSENWINLNCIFSYFSKKIQKKFEKLIIKVTSKKHLDYYSSGDLFRLYFKKFKFTKFKLALSQTFKNSH